MGKLFFHHIAPAPADPIFGLQRAFEADPRPHKVNLGMGVYKNDQLITPVLESVKEAEAFLIREEKTKNYLPIEGDRVFLQRIGGLIFGDFFWSGEGKRICGVQTLGGTGGLRIGGEFLKQEVGERVVISDPTWPNHKGVFERCQMVVGHYPYYDRHKNQLVFERTCEYLKNLAPGTVVVLHGCCHNPTGADYSLEQWKELVGLFQDKGLLPLFDFAYQGWGRGLEEDAAAIRLFAGAGLEMLVAGSQSKNFGLYSERIGALFVVTPSEKAAETVSSKMKTIIRTNYSNPPRHGAAIVGHILSTPELRARWEKEMKGMRERIERLRRRFTQELSSKQDYSYLAESKGMFCYTGLDPKQVERLKKEFAIYLTSDGRMNVAGLSDENLSRVVEDIACLL